jgi:2-amino-4-hydroxy-6-hydroxymethyldihydropteridine diphosphokinase
VASGQPELVPRAYVSIGSNIDREENVRAAVEALEARFGRVLRSRIFETAAVGFEGTPFLNLAAAFDTKLSPLEVVAVLKGIEDSRGRQRDVPRLSARTLDIDLLLYDDLVCTQEGLQLPRDETIRHAFVLCPLADLAPDLVHPVLKRTMAELWAAFDADAEPLRPVALEV